MKWDFDLFTVLLLIILLVLLVFVIADYLKFNKFIMQNNERERLFTDEQFNKYLEKIDKSKKEETKEEVDFDF